MQCSNKNTAIFQLEKEWRNSGSKGSLQALNEMARKEIDWDQLELFAKSNELTLFGGVRADHYKG